MPDCTTCAVNIYRLCTRYFDVTSNKAECGDYRELPDRILAAAEVRELLEQESF